MSGRTKHDCEQAGVRFLAGGEPQSANRSLTVGEWLEMWLERASPAVRPQSADRYRRDIRLHLAPVLGDARLVRLDAPSIQRAYSALSARGLSPQSIRMAHAVLDMALGMAVRDGVLPRNPADHVVLPRKPERELVVWSREEAVRFLREADADRLHALYRLAIATGLRRGELLGLRWEDLDLARGTLSVRRTLARITGGWVDGEPKTRSGRRHIPLDASTVDHLARWRGEQQAELEPMTAEVVFTGVRGKRLHPNVLAQQYEELLARAGVSRIAFHQLRHTHATLALAAGIHPRVVQQRLGHADMSLTMATYTHVLEEVERQAADRVGRLLDMEDNLGSA